MRAQVTIEHAALSSDMHVTFLDLSDQGLTVERHTVDNSDPEYQLLAQAIDRFVRVQRVIKERKAVSA